LYIAQVSHETMIYLLLATFTTDRSRIRSNKCNL